MQLAICNLKLADFLGEKVTFFGTRLSVKVNELLVFKLAASG